MLDRSLDKKGREKLMLYFISIMKVQLYTYTVILYLILCACRVYDSIITLMPTWLFCLPLNLHRSVDWSGQIESLRLVV